MNYMSIMEFISNPSELLMLIERRMAPLYPNADLVIVFGSVANKNLKIDSDIDLLVVSDVLSRGDIFKAMDYFAEEFGLGYDLILYTTEKFRVNSNRKIIQTALREGVILWEKEKTQSK